MSDLVKKAMSNSGADTRRWDVLQRVDDKVDKDGVLVASAGSTLELEPGESADVMVPVDFEDPWLKEAKVGSPKKEAPKKEPAASQA